jgi:EAL domain-containing protein (putative c-di-GMP-specific phosphodiesterase class I)
VFQPIVRLADGETIGFEALTRFHDGRSPDIRFAQAAAVGLGLDLEIETLRASLAASAGLPDGVFLSVNVSPALVLNRTRLEATLRAATRPIVLEITEREPVIDYGALRSAISRIVAPLQWAIDDAGAGYASLRHIIELRPQFVKLDRELIAGIALDPARQALVAGLLHFSDALGTMLIGEGIETTAERIALRRLGVVAGQGWLLGRPARIDSETGPPAGYTDSPA